MYSFLTWYRLVQHNSVPVNNSTCVHKIYLFLLIEGGPKLLKGTVHRVYMRGPRKLKLRNTVFSSYAAFVNILKELNLN